jgi:hypothetical protein
MACDTCGKTNVELVKLVDIYKTEEICDVCKDCEKEINKQLWKIKGITADIQQGLLKRFMANMRAAIRARGRG